jgi:hypothetical protein
MIVLIEDFAPSDINFCPAQYAAPRDPLVGLRPADGGPHGLSRGPKTS